LNYRTPTEIYDASMGKKSQDTVFEIDDSLLKKLHFIHQPQKKDSQHGLKMVA
jgi:hypothetical protein